MKAQALKPSFLTMPSMKRPTVRIEASDAEKALHALSNTSGWTVLNEFINDLIHDLDVMNSQAIASGASFEDIGKNTVVVNMAKEVINRIQTKVSDAKDAVEKINE